MLKMSNNNKGFTLAELLVAMAVFAIIMMEVSAVMFNSSKLYKNGVLEVNLQTEAQQAIAQVQNLIINSDKNSISTNRITAGSVSYDNITFKIDGDEYEISMSMAAGDKYGQLMYNGPTTTTPVLMADYVKSITLDTTYYAAGDRVYLCIEMYDGQYSYMAGMDIFLRNNSNGKRNVSENEAPEDGTIILDVLRYKTYDLYEVIGVDPASMSVNFAFRPESSSANEIAGVGGATEVVYLLSGNILKTSTFFNKTNDEFGKSTAIYIDATDGATGALLRSIKISSEKVMYGNEGKDFCVAPTKTGGEYCESYSFVQGIYVGASNVSYTVEYTYKYAGITITGSNLGTEVANGKPYNFQFDGGNSRIDGGLNSIVFFAKNFKTCTGDYGEFLTYGGELYFTFVITYKDAAGHAERVDTLKMYPLPCDDGAPDLPASFYSNFDGKQANPTGGLTAI